MEQIRIQKSNKRKNFLDIKIRNNILLELISKQVFEQYKGLELTVDMLPLLVMDVFERIHSKKHLTKEERSLVTKNIILKLYPLLKKKQELNKENLKLNDIDILNEAENEISDEMICLISNLVECFSTLSKQSQSLIQPKGCFRILFHFLKKV